MKIIYNNSITMKYSADELEKYLTIICDKKIQNNITLSVDASFDIENAYLDDAFNINIINGSGYIKGSNERSVLLGVYKFLYELGCRWIRPSNDGEIIPTVNLNDMNVNIKSKASYRHRGIVIEGANSYQNVLDIIEWLPKLGYNSYFIQFKQAYTFFEKWYIHENNPTLTPEKFNIDIATQYTNELEKEIKKRGLIYHAVGHGWTCESIGIPALGWDNENIKLQPWQQNSLAEINGERKFWCNIPNNTNLCYSNIEVQNRMVNHITQYLKEHTNIDMLHVWLADDFNNHCECEQCSKKIPTDFYIQILNRLDEKLTQEKINTKIVLLQYFELLWPPQTEHIHNADRFVYMFAPISRTLSKSFNDMDKKEYTIPEYKRNKVVLPKKLEENVAFLKQWQKQLNCDNFDFDYHLARGQYGDLGYYHISKIIYDDIQALHTLGLNGLLSCQQQRTFFPTGLPNYVMGLTLWNKNITFDEIVKDYFKHSFGEQWKKTEQYLQKLSELSDIDYWHAKKPWYMSELATKFDQIENVVKEFEPEILNNILNTQGIIKKSWQYLKYHAKYSILFSKSMSEKCKGNDEQANKYWNEFVKYIRCIELDVQPVLDIYRIIQVSKMFVNMKVDD